MEVEEPLGAERTHSHDQIPMHKLDDQRAVIARAMQVIKKFAGTRPRGWFGPGLTQTDETLDYLAEAGVEYIGDWVLDDEPVTLRTSSRPVVALPYNFEIHGIVMMALQHHESMRRRMSSQTPQAFSGLRGLHALRRLYRSRFGITRDVMRMLDEGKPLREIRAYVNRTCSRHGRPTPTPPVP